MQSRIKRNAAQCLMCNDVIESTDGQQHVECSCGNLAITGGSRMIRVLRGKPKMRSLVEYHPITPSQTPVDPNAPRA